MREPFYIRYSDQDRVKWKFGKSVWWAQVRIVTPARHDNRPTVVIAAHLKTLDDHIGKLIRTNKLDARARPTARLLQRRKEAIWLEEITTDDVKFLGLNRLGHEVTQGVYAMQDRMRRSIAESYVQDNNKRIRRRRVPYVQDTEVKPDPNWRPPEEREDLGPTLLERLTKRL